MSDSVISNIQYISCACNRIPHSADYGKNGILCYAACNSVAICDFNTTKIGKVIRTLPPHTNKVNVVRWIKFQSLKPETELISASSDGTAIVWSKKKNNYEPTSTLSINDPISICHAIYTSQDSKLNLLICTGSINGDFRLWKRDDSGEILLFQTLSFGKRIPIQACLSFLPQSKNPLLCIALDDFTIQLFSQNSVENSFFQVKTLIGHEDWVTCMDVMQDDNGNSFLASGSQDTFIRLWKLSIKQEIVNDELTTKAEEFKVNEEEYQVVLESILSGHEGWIYGVNWHPVIEINGKLTQPMKLLSCSLDKSMVVWEANQNNGFWLETVRVGEVGGNSVGFYGCKFGANGKDIMAHGYQGSFHIWRFSEDAKNWIPLSAPSGHFGEVVDLSWDPKGRFLVTVSTDQTTRIHAPWTENLENWHEIARPQIHGHDMSCLAMLAPYKFASGAEEKVVRIFTSPLTFKTCLEKISYADDFKGLLAESASIPALGLMNKAIFAQDLKETETHAGSSRDLKYDQPPVEEELIQHTLWPEEQKLYGHGYEVFTMAARHDGTLLATACKSTNPEYAAIIIWDTETWTQVQKLMAHQLTVTQLAFSPNDKYLVSVSRDRRWSLFSFDQGRYDLLAASLKKDNLHGRIIWCCGWTHDSKYFTTGSRDGKIGIWSENVHLSKPLLPVASFEGNISVTALAFAPISLSLSVYILAIGFENGEIEIQKIVIRENESVWELLAKYDSSFAHHLTVKRLQFRPQEKKTTVLQLASCGSDHAVKIYSLDIEKLVNSDL